MADVSAELAAPLRTHGRVVANRAEGGANHRLVLLVPDWPAVAPGQFAMLSAGARTEVPRTDPLLPRPMAVYRSRPAADGAEVEILYKVTGRGTGLLAEARPDDRVFVVGPLGTGFDPPAAGERAVLVGGGTGVASLYELALRCVAAGPTRVLLGARSVGDLMGREDFAELDLELRIATEDGGEGHRGLVTDLLQVAFEEGADRVYACGPTPMMRRCAEICAERGAPCQVSLENNMACGFGVCLGCAAPRREGGYALVCREGPVVEANAIDWETLP